MKKVAKKSADWILHTKAAELNLIYYLGAHLTAMKMQPDPY